MPSWQGKSRGNKTGFRIFVWVLRTFGVQPAYLLLALVSVYYFLFSWRSSRFLYAYFHWRLGYSSGRSILSIYKNYYWFGQTIIDRVVLMAGIPNRFSFDFDGEKYLRQMVEEKQGGLLLSAHIGNWEIAGQLLKRLNTEMNIVMFDGEQQRIKEYMEGVTGQRNAKIISLKMTFLIFTPSMKPLEIMSLSACMQIVSSKEIKRLPETCSINLLCSRPDRSCWPTPSGCRFPLYLP
jgi:predicted LPLAT superfamily acyltransferase